MAEAALVADADGLARALKAVPEFVVYIRFGRLLLARLVLLAGALRLLIGRGDRPALALVGAALGLQPLLAHAGAIFGARGDVLVGAEIVHVLAAGAWLGGLVPLLLSVMAVPARAAALLRRFSQLGVAAVLAIVVTGVVQLWLLTDGFAGLIGTAYGMAIALKLLLFASTLVLAALNRFVLTARIGAARPRGMLECSLASEAALGVCIVLAAGWLASLAPAG